MVAIGGTVRAGDAPRVLVRYAVDPCHLLDLRAVPDLLVDAARPWREALAAGREPPSWAAADAARAMAPGLIDPSRRRPGLWHVTLFRWNEAGAPGVRMLDAEPIVVPEGYR